MQRKTRKNIFAALAITLCAGIFTACGGSNTVAFNAFWHKNATAPTPGIETLTYSVSFEAGTGLGFGYSVKDATGTYTTVLTTDVTEGKMTYQYTTQLNVAITYEFKG